MEHMRLYLMRHGDAGDRASWEGSDFERPLTEKGQTRTLAMAEHLDAIGVVPRRLITSPLARAAQTAAIVAEVLGEVETLVQDERVGHGLSVDDLAEILDENAQSEALLIVGHEPSLSRVTADLIGGGDIFLKKGAVICLDIALRTGKGRPRPEGTLMWLLTPGSLGF